MINFILRRLLISIVLLLGIGLVSFTVIQLPPGDFASSYQNYLTNQAGMTQEEAEAAANMVRARYGLDQPLPLQFVSWIKGIVTKGEFGFSFAYRKDAGELIADRLPKTLMLAALAHAISTIVGLALGIFVAPRQYSLADNVSAIVAFILTSVPRFFLALAKRFQNVPSGTPVFMYQWVEDNYLGEAIWSPVDQQLPEVRPDTIPVYNK